MDPNAEINRIIRDLTLLRDAVAKRSADPDDEVAERLMGAENEIHQLRFLKLINQAKIEKLQRQVQEVREFAQHLRFRRPEHVYANSVRLQKDIADLIERALDQPRT